ncbi:patatin-like phospholipase family protein [Roseibium alexandrii]
MTGRRILSLDGGGVRGIVSVAFLLRIEQLLEQRSKRPHRLCDYFDLIGGTSTGAIIATALATGMSARDVKDFYFHLAPKIFKKSHFRLLGFHHVFDGERLRAEMRAVLGDGTLESQKLQTRLAIITKRVDTGSAWIVTNNPKAKYWNDPSDGSYIGNRHLKLVDLVRASTAAPHYFAPEKIKIVKRMSPGLFVDGGVTPHNNPALALFQLVSIPGFGFDWPIGADRLSILSIGTGSFRQKLDAQSARRTPAALLAIKGLSGLIQDCEQNVLTTMQMLGRSPDPVKINSEIGAVAGQNVLSEPLFSFQRYDINLERGWLADVLELDLTEKTIKDLQKMDNPEIVPVIFDLASRAAEQIVKPDHIDLFMRNKKRQIPS